MEIQEAFDITNKRIVELAETMEIIIKDLEKLKKEISFIKEKADQNVKYILQENKKSDDKFICFSNELITIRRDMNKK